jgi:hypothetical protein
LGAQRGYRLDHLLDDLIVYQTSVLSSTMDRPQIFVGLEECWCFFVVEEPALAFDAAAVAGEGSVGSDDAMTGDDDGDGIGAVGEADRANRRGPADGGGEFAVGSGCTAGNVAQSLPDLALEGRAGGGDGEIVDDAQLAGEVARDGVGEAVGIACGGENESVRAVVFAQLAEDDCVALAEQGRAQIAGLVGDEHQGADGSREPIERERKWAGMEDVGHERNRKDSSAFSHGRGSIGRHCLRCRNVLVLTRTVVKEC